jgi:hypothetical protein
MVLKSLSLLLYAYTDVYPTPDFFILPRSFKLYIH